MRLSKTLTRTFALYRQKHNPDKHLFLRTFDNTAYSYAWFGRVFELKRTATREPSQQLCDQIASKAYEYFSLVYPEKFNLNFNDYAKTKANSWWTYDVDFKEHLPDLLLFLDTRVHNQDTRLRQNVERLVRQSFHENDLADDFQNKSIEKFIIAYASEIESTNLVASNDLSSVVNKIPLDSVRQLLKFDQTTPEISKFNLSGKSDHALNQLFEWLHS